MDLRSIIAVSGMPGLFKVISQSRGGVIVEGLSDKKRIMISGDQRISGLENISVFTTGEDVILEDVLLKMKASITSPVDTKASPDQLKEKFATVLPDFDKERVHASDIKKIFNWYNILLGIDDVWVEKKAEEAAADGEAKPSIPVPGEKQKAHFNKGATKVNTQGGHIGRSAIPQKKGGG